MKDYKEILEGVMNIINTTEISDIGFVNICTYISENCPELKESEDERIRKRIYDYINVTLDDNESEEKEKWLAFLSKQGGEQILANFAKTCKVEPKFKVGDWVVTDKCDTVQIGAVNNGYYTMYNGMIFNVSYVDKCWHLWTIADAKPGDVLACENGWICIFRCLNDNLFSSHCFMDDEGWFCEYGGQGHTLDNSICGEIHPATKEQRDILFAKMKEAGYEWDSEKKQPRKIEQKPAVEWSEEDKKMIDSIYHSLNYESIAEGLRCSGIEYGDDPETILIKQRSWLKSIRPKQKQEWSEKDEKMLYNLITLIRGGAHFAYEEEIEWLKSLSLRYHWRPSEEMLEALDIAIRAGIHLGTWEEEALRELQKQLKEL